MFKAVCLLFLIILFFSLPVVRAAEPSSGEHVLLHLHDREKQHELTRLWRGQKLTVQGFKNLAVWEPESLKLPNPSPVPLVIFSHGFRAANSRSAFLTSALAQAGYLVIAPNHKDSFTRGLPRQQAGFFKPGDWSEFTYKDREEDILNLVAALHQDPVWNARIDWSKLALAGHSLGGYTVLGLAGAWRNWKLPGVKAVIALAPYTNPYISKGTLENIDVPVMYQSGSRDTWIHPTVKSCAFTQTPSPAVFVEFDTNHFAWTNLNRDRRNAELISHYCIEFLNKYVREEKTATPAVKLAGVTTLRAK